MEIAPYDLATTTEQELDQIREAAFARTMDWDRINSVALRVYERAIVKRERLSRMTGR